MERVTRWKKIIAMLTIIAFLCPSAALAASGGFRQKNTIFRESAGKEYARQLLRGERQSRLRQK